MELASVPEIGPSLAGKLRDAGVESAEALATWDDLAALAAASGMGAERLESYRDAARAHLERALAESGIAGPEALAAADPVELAARTGISVEYLDRYRAKAEAAVVADARVVLVDGAPVARVTLGGRVYDAVKLLTARADEDGESVLARATGDAVLLQPAAEVVPVVLSGARHRGLPLYRERRTLGGDVEEVRVRVASIAEVEAPKPAEKKGLGKLFSRGKK